ncbi:hypothetical protein [Corallincola holothuriorum]|uniref:hypothetical protein n=1 Tax=Corallincola holothuriorum TaxID=2282215 RepID=UPI0011C03CBD|nr:hypothetical protein [Corallincola holothuriorum]
MSNPAHKILVLATTSSLTDAESNMLVELTSDADRFINHNLPIDCRGQHRCGMALRATPIKA